MNLKCVSVLDRLGSPVSQYYVTLLKSIPQYFYSRKQIFSFTLRLVSKYARIN